MFQSVARPKSARKRGRRRRKSVQRASERALLAGSFTFAKDHAEERADALGAALAPELSEVRSGPLGPREVAAAHAALGVDLSGTELRDDDEARAKADRFGARALTEGREISFGAGELAPHTPRGRRLIGHELAHAATQKTSGARAPQAASRCDAEGPRREVDPENSAVPPLVYKTGDPKLLNLRAIRPSVGYAQRLLNVFLARVAAGEVACNESMDTNRFAALRARLKDPSRIEVDCFFWTETDAAARMFQLCDGLDEDGKIGKDTWTALEAFVGVAPSPGDTPETPELPDLELPDVVTPEEPIGPVPGPDARGLFCVPFLTKVEAAIARSSVKLKASLFLPKFTKEAGELYDTYLNTPKTGTRGTLPPRRVFSTPKSGLARDFQNDPETTEHTDLLMGILVNGVRGRVDLIPSPGQVSGPHPLRKAIPAAELLNRDMSFGDPFNRSPGLVAGGPALNASDAGDDVRNVDGRFTVSNFGGVVRVSAAFVFDVFDAVDFCPGAPGGILAQALLTTEMSRLEATPDVPTYDTPFEVIYSVRRDQDL